VDLGLRWGRTGRNSRREEERNGGDGLRTRLNFPAA